MKAEPNFLKGTSIFGIDSSSRCTGWCEIEATPPYKLLRTGKIRAVPHGEKFMDNYEKYCADIYMHLREAFDQCLRKPSCIAIEETAVVKGNETAKALIGLYQFIRICFSRDTGVPVNVVNASHAKAVYTGSGKASKQECVAYTNKRYGTAFVFVEKDKDKNLLSDEDVCDSIQTAVSLGMDME
jgi:Holliday junction resolvasome RuvABC endonuclease subunit